MTMLSVTAVTLFVAALSPSLSILILASYGIGTATIAAQILFTLCYGFSPPKRVRKDYRQFNECLVCWHFTS